MFNLFFPPALQKLSGNFFLKIVIYLFLVGNLLFISECHSGSTAAAVIGKEIVYTKKLIIIKINFLTSCNCVLFSLLHFSYFVLCRRLDLNQSRLCFAANLQRPNRKFGFIWNILYQNFDTILISLIRSHK